MSDLLKVSDLSIEFGRGAGLVQAVSEMSFALTRGRTLAIVGESGSGKSVTALALLGLLGHVGGRVTAGGIEFESEVLSGASATASVDICTLDEARLRLVRGNEIAMISQEPMSALNPVFTIGSQLLETLRLHRHLSSRDATREARALLEQVRLPNAARLLDQYPHQLSGGMRQRVMIALALCCRPKLLIADEPTTALDVTIQAEILGIVRELQADLDMALLFISHDMAVVSEMADEVLVMRYGRTVERGDASTVLHTPCADYTRELLAAVPRIGSMRGRSRPMGFGVATDSPEPDVGDGEVTDAVAHDGRDNRPGDGIGAGKPCGNIDGTGVAEHPTSPLLRLEGLTTRYDIRGGFLNRITHRVYAAESIDLHIDAGETLALVGESGSGKSTIGKTIQQLVAPIAGEMRFEGSAVFGGSSATRRLCRRAISYVFQDPYGSLDPRMSVGRSIAEPIRTHSLLEGEKVIRRRVAELMTRVGLDPSRAGRYPHEFSGGQRQRLCIARALASEPKLVIADEAVSALDVLVQAQVIDLLLDLQRDTGLAFLFITHDMAVVERISHRVAVMYLGQIVETGSRRQIFENPRHAYTRKLLDAVPVIGREPRTRSERGAGELPSPVRRADDPPAVRRLVELEPGHLVAMDPPIARVA